MGLIYLDSCLLIYAVEDHPAYGDMVRRWLASVPGDALAISPLVELECLVAPMRAGHLQLQQRYLDAFAQVALLTMPAAVYRAATRLRADFGLRTPDALHLATAQHHRCAALWTNDQRLHRAAHGLAVTVG